ncbi:unnamed protein product [Polarella glacialis]|uniref:MIF4G domain-containing protein n=1 Tax=Polarella glacialis TaxID=89957 RepID=A0A813HE42_POLGL|nr:unnamed protein product [Polarella glacialis]
MMTVGVSEEPNPQDAADEKPKANANALLHAHSEECCFAVRAPSPRSSDGLPVVRFSAPPSPSSPASARLLTVSLEAPREPAVLLPPSRECRPTYRPDFLLRCWAQLAKDPQQASTRGLHTQLFPAEKPVGEVVTSWRRSAAAAASPVVHTKQLGGGAAAVQWSQNRRGLRQVPQTQQRSLRAQRQPQHFSDSLKPSLRGYRVTSAATREQELSRAVLGQLNKVCPSNLQRIVDNVAAIELRNGKDLETLIHVVFSKALEEPHYSETYADLVFKLRSLLPEFPASEDEVSARPSVTFFRVLLTSCQNEFERLPARLEDSSDDSSDSDFASHNAANSEAEEGDNVRKPSPRAGMKEAAKEKVKQRMKQKKAEEAQAQSRDSSSPQDQNTLDEQAADEAKIREDRRRRRKGRLLANMRFIGHLFLRRLLAVKVIGTIVHELVGFREEQPEAVPQEHCVEAVCELLQAIGHTLDSSPDGRKLMQLFLLRLCELASARSSVPEGQHKLSQRTRFQILDLRELQANAWVKKEFREQAQAREELRRQSESARAAAARSSRPGWGCRSSDAESTMFTMRTAGCRPFYIQQLLRDQQQHSQRQGELQPRVEQKAALQSTNIHGVRILQKGAALDGNGSSNSSSRKADCMKPDVSSTQKSLSTAPQDCGRAQVLRILSLFAEEQSCTALLDDWNQAAPTEKLVDEGLSWILQIGLDDARRRATCAEALAALTLFGAIRGEMMSRLMESQLERLEDALIDDPSAGEFFHRFLAKALLPEETRDADPAFVQSLVTSWPVHLLLGAVLLVETEAGTAAVLECLRSPLSGGLFGKLRGARPPRLGHLLELVDGDKAVNSSGSI